MKPYLLTCEMETPVALEETFRVFEDPHNLARITPAWLNFRVTSPGRVTMRQDAEIAYTIRWLGLPMKWKTRISVYDPPHRFVDQQEEGPYALWRHTHSFTPSGGGTRVRDEVEYILPLRALGRVAHSLMVGRQLRQIFEFRQRTLPSLIGGDPGRYRTTPVTIR